MSRMLMAAEDRETPRLSDDRRKALNLAITHTAGHLTQAGFDLVVPRDAVGGTPKDYAQQVLDNTIAVLGRLTTVDQLIGEWTPVKSDR